MQAQLEKILNLWLSMSYTQRILLGTLSFAAVLIVFFFYSQSQEDFAVMLSDLEEGDAAAVVQDLKAKNIPFRLAEDGTTILVPRSKKEEIRLGVFKDELIKSDKAVGFGALGSLPFGMTDWQEQKYDQKIISDEVVNTLERIQGIKKARVILAQGQDGLFSSEKTDTTASVMLIVEPGFRMKPDQVKTVKQLVSHAVPGLDPRNVAISDSMGNSLTDDMGMVNGAGGSESDDTRSTFEKQKAKDIQEMLVAVVGPNNAVVKVSATMNFDKAESKIKRFIPSGGSEDSPTGIPVSVQRNAEVYTGKKGGAPQPGKEGGGEPGVNSNIPTYQADDKGTSESDKGSDYQNQQVTTNYEISSEEKTIVHAAGTVEKMSIAVVVNKVLTQSENDELKQLIISASGVDVTRGDTVTVSGLQFSPEIQDQQKSAVEEMNQAEQQKFMMTIVQYAGLFILASVALFVFYRLMGRPIQGEVVSQFDDDEAAYIALPEQKEISLLGTSSIPALEAKLDPEVEEMKEAIGAMVQKDPGEAARVLVTFMKDM